MDAVKYFKELDRMSLNDNDSYNKLGFILEVEDKVKFVEEWSKAHPKKTRMQDFFEKYPNAKKDDDGTPNVCAEDLGYCVCNELTLTDCCYFCWNEPIE